MKHWSPLLLIPIFVAACSPVTPTTEAEPLHVQYTFAAQPWLSTVYDCAGSTVVSTELRAAESFDFNTINFAIRIGENSQHSLPTYQIGSEDILVIINRQNPINGLSTEEVLGLFTGRIQTWQEINGSSDPVQVWVFSAGEEVQQIFEQTALGNAPVTSTARLAPDPEEMATAVANDVNAVGILTGHWITGNVSEVYSATTVPVLVILPVEPQGVMIDLLACLQK
jgi:hypothetical protein